MMAERETLVSDRYGTFKESEDGKAELHAVIDDERWRLQKHHRWFGRARLALGVSLSMVAIGIVFFSRAQQPALKPSQGPTHSVSHAVSTSTSNDAVGVQSVWVYRDNDGDIAVEFGTSESNGAPVEAWATFNDSLHAIGWSQLWVHTANLTKDEYDDKEAARQRRKDIMYAAGYAEGLLTHHRIDQHFNNVYLTFFPENNEEDKMTVQKLHEFFRKNIDWMHKQIRNHEEYPHLPDAEYWEAMSYILAQFDGLAAGYHRATQSDSPASVLDLFMLNADGDMEDLVAVVKRRRHHTSDESADARDNDFVAISPTVDFYTFVKNLKCSALVRILPGFSDLVWGHATWDTYASMNRIFKHYDVPLPGGKSHKTAVKRRISMSSSPGFLSSVDDWYMTSAGLGIFETTNGVFDSGLYDIVTPQSVPCWLRSKIANFLSEDGLTWAEIFAKYNSGTYNNQWMVIDSKQFVKGEGFKQNGFTVLEQLPDFVQVEDLSEVINTQGYWASYNVPYFEAVYKRSGFEHAFNASNHSASWSHEQCARARIFKRDAPQIKTFEDFKRVIRSNNWHSDPLSEGHASHAVASRYDLEVDAQLFSLDGAIDAKVTSLERLARLECDAAAGPTHDNNPVFEWTPEMQALSPNEGHPRRFDFHFQPMVHSP